MKLDVMIFAAHPDDAELGMGGTIANLTSEGKKVGVIDLSAGELGSRGNAGTRNKEAAEATKILNLTYRENLGFADGNLRPNLEYRKIIVSLIRKYKPGIIFAPYNNDRHPDHIGVSMLIKEAMFFSGVTKYETEDDEGLQKAYRPKKLFYFMQTYEFPPTFIIDISNTFKQKMDAVFAFNTQFHNPNAENEGPETFISSPEFIKFLEARAKYFGFKIGKEYGEAFYCEELIEYDLNYLLEGGK
ncbi:MAG: bacillithiol biosynthesis deacetylase BshB1 [Melioribacteraceae bacterium]|nr:bacillithiol biosynthesis deacetylase BshB1 [Melioribacteraceae bacterium]